MLSTSCLPVFVPFPWHVPSPWHALPAAHCAESFFKAQSPVKPFPVLLVKITQGFTEQFVGFTRALVSVSRTEECGLTPSYACELLPLNDQFLLKQRPSLFVLCTSHSAHTARSWDHSPTEVVNHLGRSIFSCFDHFEGTKNSSLKYVRGARDAGLYSGRKRRAREESLDSSL